MFALLFNFKQLRTAFLLNLNKGDKKNITRLICNGSCISNKVTDEEGSCISNKITDEEGSCISNKFSYKCLIFGLLDWLSEESPFPVIGSGLG